MSKMDNGLDKAMSTLSTESPAVSREVLAETITSLADAFDQELFAKTQDQLEDYWYFTFDRNRSLESNIYNFHDMLELYGSFCRRWEEHHNGSCCVVERVRDKYLWSKIVKFASDLTKKDG